MNKYLMLLIGVTLYLSSCSSSDYTKDLGDGYLLVSESNANQFITHSENLNGQVTIPCTVKSFLFNDSFIVATQENNPDCSDQKKTKFPLSYWIVDKNKKEIIGPLDSLSYVKKCSELFVPASLDVRE